MPKLATLAFGTIGVLAAGWSGGWFYGESKIRTGLDEEIARMAQQGVAASYQSVEIEGFPFSYRGKVVEPSTEAIALLGRIPTRTNWRAPWILFETSISDLGVINFTLPETQTVRLTPAQGGPTADIEVQSTQFEGSLQRGSSGARITGEGQGIAITATSQALINPMELKAEKISIDSSAPLSEPGPIKAAANLSGLTANESIWGFFDPGKRFPRDPANLSLVANADTGIRAGLGGLLENAAKAGFLPEKQASLYSATLSNFAKKGEVEGEQVFNIAFKGGYLYVNGLPTFIPAPLLP